MDDLQLTSQTTANRLSPFWRNSSVTNLGISAERYIQFMKIWKVSKDVER